MNFCVIRESDMADDTFTEKFRSELSSALHQYLVADQNVVFRMPEASPDVGELVVWNDGDELTVGVGKISHHHFSTWNFVGLPPAEQGKDQATTHKNSTADPK